MHENYPIIDVSPLDLHPAAYQPKERGNYDNGLKALMRSIREDGLQYPPLVARLPVGDGFSIIDGHRRVRAAKELGWPKIPVLVSSQGDSRHLFAAVSGVSKRLTAVQWVEVFLGGGSLPPGPTATCIKQLRMLMGDEFLRDLVTKGLSPTVWHLANKLVRYLELDEDAKRLLLTWLIKHKLPHQVRAAITGDPPKPAKELLTAFKADQPI